MYKRQFMDRAFYSGGSKMAGKPAAAVVSCRRGGATAGFDQINKYFTINNMPVVSSQYWNMVHGNTPDEVRQDEEGLQTMRTLGNNMAWLIKCCLLYTSDPVGDHFHDGEVMRNENVGQIEFLLQMMEEVQHLGLDGNVQSGNGLVGDDELRFYGQGPGDSDTLFLTAGELVRITLCVFRA